MYYKNIYIRDFGIFNNQKLNNLNQNIVVIGGKNRAGKSSFFNIIKYLPFAFPQDNSIPPARNNYYLEAELKAEAKNYFLTLDGYAKAKIVDDKANNYNPKTIFNNLDQFSYQQLFTISLDELQQLNNITKAKKERKKLFSVLLGAGLSELTRVPEIAEKFYKNARNIGGTLGDPAVASFKSYYQDIKKSEKVRDQAFKEIEEYNQKTAELNKKNSELIALNKNITKLKREEFLLDILKNNFNKIEKIEKLKFTLEEKKEAGFVNFSTEKLEKAKNYQRNFKNLSKKISEEKNELKSTAKNNQVNNLIKDFLKINKEINDFQQKKDLYKERIRNLVENKNKVDGKINELKNELKDLNFEMEAPLVELKNIRLDFIDEKEMLKKITEYQNLNSDIKDLKEKKEDIELQLKTLKEKKGEFDFIEPKKILKRSYLMIIISALLGAFSLANNLNFLFYLSFVLVLSTYIYYSSNYKSAKLRNENKKELKNKIVNLENNISVLESNLEEKIEAKNNLKMELENYAGILNISAIDYIPLLSDYYRELRTKKKYYRNLKSEKEAIQAKLELNQNNLKEILNLIIKIEEVSTLDLYTGKKTNKNLIENSEQLFNDLDKIYKYSQKVKIVSELETEKKLLEAEINKFLNNYKKELNIEANLKNDLNSYLNKLKTAQNYEKINQKYILEKKEFNYTLNSSDKIKKYLNQENENNKNNYGFFLDLYQEYSSLKAAENDYQEKKNKLKRLKNEKEELENKINTLDNKIDTLATSEKIEVAQKNINQAQNNLKTLADRYALNKSIYFILNKLRTRMIKKAKTELLKPAADILAKITGNEYQNIKSSIDLEKTSFMAVKKETNKIEKVEELSRATMEQLFLAVRISRIKEIKPPLPLVLDDTFVNFDQRSLYYSAKIISELAADHQIFILSCHPHLIDFISKSTKKAQYWQLEKGDFKLSDADN